MVSKRLLREVGTRKDRLLLRREENGHGPAAPASGCGDHIHVDPVDIWPLLTINLDIDEVLVHERSGLVVLEGLMCHHMTPVAGGVSNGQDDRHVPALGLRECLVTPFVPVNRVVLMLEQVRRSGVGESVGHGREVTGPVPGRLTKFRPSESCRFWCLV